jgi:23S rRNA pseudouridine2605 synthase
MRGVGYFAMEKNRRQPGHVSLERALSKLGLASRSEARDLIRTGRVAIDGRTETDPLQEVIPERIRIEIDGRPAQRAAPLTILLHKPRGLVTTRSDPQGRPTVYGCLEGLDTHVVPIGRLDAATSGLLLLTNDTRFADWVTDPGNGVPRVYAVTVRGELSDGTARRLEEGIEEAGEILAARSVAIRKRSKRETHLIVELTEGKNRWPRGNPAQADLLRRVGAGRSGAGEVAHGLDRRAESGVSRRSHPRKVICFRRFGVDLWMEVGTMTYTVQEAQKRLSEILQKVQDGERVILSDEGRSVAEIRAVISVDPDDPLRELIEEGIIVPASEPRASLEEVLRELEELWRTNPPEPGGLARFLESRD